ncbi:unnamed protein product [Spirodela intermedia]|uniref:Tf2-1-like SH3-like domain-containing protein n=1 Tax=Spirodela intermedia TaxID=51605 RepID=A0A7I8J8V6_SPIIN|nr:unnamed protein product [Spirodela intermedia]CAA6666529.1 unnamed protein product [Spirodela intermedia]
MVRMRPECYAPGSATKLHAHSAGPFCVLSRIGENAYRIDGERNPSPSAQETPAVRIQPDRRTKTKEPGFRYTA